MGMLYKGMLVVDVVIGFSEFFGLIGIEVIVLVVEVLFLVVDIVDGGEWVKGDVLVVLNSFNIFGIVWFNQCFLQVILVSVCGQGVEMVVGVCYYSMSGIGFLINVFDLSFVGLVVIGLLFGEVNDGLVG